MSLPAQAISALTLNPPSAATRRKGVEQPIRTAGFLVGQKLAEQTFRIW